MENEKKNLSYEEKRVLEKKEISNNIDRLNLILKLMGFQVNSKHEDFYRAYAHGTKENKEIYLTANDYRTKNKIHVCGIFPKDSKKNYFNYEVEKTEYKSINISMNKTNEQIIKDINKRFMPNYIIALNKVLERIKQNEENYKNHNNSIEECKQILNLDFDKYHSGVRFWNIQQNEPIKSINIESLSNGQEIEIKVRGNKKEILKILQTLKEVM